MKGHDFSNYIKEGRGGGAEQKQAETGGDHKISHTCQYRTVQPPSLVSNEQFLKLFKSNQSASKHGRRTFIYSATRELVCNG